MGFPPTSIVSYLVDPASGHMLVSKTKPHEIKFREGLRMLLLLYAIIPYLSAHMNYI